MASGDPTNPFLGEMNVKVSEEPYLRVKRSRYYIFSTQLYSKNLTYNKKEMTRMNETREEGDVSKTGPLDM